MERFQQIDKNRERLRAVHLFEGNLLEQLRGYFRVLLTWSSNALEENALTQMKVTVVLGDGLSPGGSPVGDMFETVGHGGAYDYMFSRLGSSAVAEKDILAMHRRLFQYSQPHAGSYRRKNVYITGSAYPVPGYEHVPGEMEELVEWMNTQQGMYYPVEYAAQLHKRFVFLLPFVDGNGQVARLLMNTALLREEYLPAVIHPEQRKEYIAVLEQAHADDRPFVRFVAERELDTQRLIMRLLHMEPGK